MQTRRSVLAALSGALTRPAFAAAAADYPSGPVKIIVSFPAGGSIDVVMRAMAAPLQAKLGKPVVIVVNPELPVHSVKELIALLKQKPGQINFGHGGPGSAIHLAAELFQIMTGTTMTGIAYRGAPLALNDVIAGRVSLMFADAGSVSGQIKAGQVRALGVSSTERVPALPDVPTIAEAGVPGFEAVGWTLVCVPAATPKPIQAKLGEALGAAAHTPEVQALMQRLGTLPVTSP